MKNQIKNKITFKKRHNYAYDVNLKNKYFIEVYLEGKKTPYIIVPSTIYSEMFKADECYIILKFKHKVKSYHFAYSYLRKNDSDIGLYSFDLLDAKNKVTEILSENTLLKEYSNFYIRYKEEKPYVINVRTYTAPNIYINNYVVNNTVDIVPVINCQVPIMNYQMQIAFDVVKNKEG